MGSDSLICETRETTHNGFRDYDQQFGAGAKAEAKEIGHPSCTAIMKAVERELNVLSPKERVQVLGDLKGRITWEKKQAKVDLVRQQATTAYRRDFHMPNAYIQDHITLLEQDPTAISLSLLSIEELDGILTAESDKLIQNDVKRCAAELIRQKILVLPMPQEIQDPTAFWSKNRSAYVEQQILANALQYISIQSIDQLAQILMHAQPRGFLNSKSLSEIYRHIVGSSQLSPGDFFYAVFQAIQKAPSRALNVMNDNNMDQRKHAYELARLYHSNRQFYDKMHIDGVSARYDQQTKQLACIYIVDEDLLKRMEWTADDAQEPSFAQMLHYYSDCVQAYKDVFKELDLQKDCDQEDCDQEDCDQEDCDYRIREQKYLQIKDQIKPEQLIPALAWRVLLDYASDFSEWDVMVAREIARQVHGEGQTTLSTHIEELDPEQWQTLQNLFSDDQGVIDRLASASPSPLEY